MNNKNTSTTNSTTTRNNLTYIESLISGATQQGLFSIVVPNNQIDDAMADDIRSYGYDVFKKNNFLGSNYDYVISWLNSSTNQTNNLVEVANNAYDLRLQSIKFNNVDLILEHGKDFVIYPGDSASFNTNETGLVSVQIIYETGTSTVQSIQITDSDSVSQCIDVANTGGGLTLMVFNNVQMGNNPIYIEALASNC